jgi:hypothetical protein
MLQACGRATALVPPAFDALVMLLAAAPAAPFTGSAQPRQRGTWHACVHVPAVAVCVGHAPRVCLRRELLLHCWRRRHDVGLMRSVMPQWLATVHARTLCASASRCASVGCTLTGVLVCFVRAMPLLPANWTEQVHALG